MANHNHALLIAGKFMKRLSNYSRAQVKIPCTSKLLASDCMARGGI